MTEQTPTLPQPPSRLGGLIRRNPIALKELRGRMRGSRAFVILSVYVALMSVFTVVLYLIYMASQATALSTSGGVVGKLIFGGIVAIELFLVCFIAPAFTAGAISGERERGTFDLLRTTLLPARRVVMGKLISALAYIVLLLLVAVPLQSLAFLMGGISIAEVLLSVELLLVTAIGYGAMGLFLSAATKRTLTASILTYTFALVMTVAMPLASLMMSILTTSGAARGSVFVEGALHVISLLLSATNPIGAAIFTEVVLQQNATAFLYTETLSNGANLPLLSPWIVYTVLYLAGA
ncbi:MAG TPA: ABC transporter permease subunit, partial [Aggregatilineales bacterium]|nr:ABC transporter permease subunit [Aggregatilineales bacterium]